MAKVFYYRFMYITPSRGNSFLNSNLPFKLIQGASRLFSDVWSENAALFKRFMKIYKNSPILPYVPEKLQSDFPHQ